MARVLLVLPSATYRARDFLSAARAVGAEVIVASNRRPAMSAAMGNRAVTLDLRRPEAAAQAIALLAERTPLDAIVAVDDEGVRAAALAAARLGLPGNPPEAVGATRDKAAMRRALAAAGVPQPAHGLASPDVEVAGVAAAVGLPCVVKPLSLSASRGVIRADDADAAAAAAERVREILAAAGEDPEGPLLVERYVPGREVAVEGLLRGGALEVLAIFDKPDPLEGPYFEETLLVTPSRLPADVLDTVRRLAGEAATALGLVEGPVHAELRIGSEGAPSEGASAEGAPSEGASVLELAARSIGGLCSRALRFGAGVSLEELILRHALGLSVDDSRRADAASGVMMIPVSRAGALIEVSGQEDARAVPGVAGLEISVAPGRVVRPLPEGDRYLGFIFARGESPEEVEAALRTAHACLEVRIGEPAGVATA